MRRIMVAMLVPPVALGAHNASRIAPKLHHSHGSPGDVRAVCRLLHAPAGEERLPVGRLMLARRGVFYFSRISTAARLQPGSLVPRAVRFRMTQGCEGHQGYRAVGRDAQAWHATIVSLSAARAP